eukprot:CAMPEP_0172678196 /NCGR_PEP_ID=MMETSP1074-20121228/15221_1 /TAXON_ID=2916 /ORGANISM="Ceratium fusus, Strain PA161109" /LENGTH=69 /DNA_ID=CAMNT_0013496173 /DNA_START=471 /DNA_END=676 /DNA_ORIENTATION=+
MSPGGLAVETFTPTPYGQRALFCAKKDNVAEEFLGHGRIGTDAWTCTCLQRVLELKTVAAAAAAAAAAA